MDDYRGEEFINKKNPNLHMSHEIMHHAEKSDSPKEKIRRYLDRLERITKKTTDENRPTHENDRRLLRKLYYRKYIIKSENIPESYFELQEQIAKERGEGYLRYDEETKEQEREQIISEQRHSLDKWLDYFESSDTEVYPMWFKYYAFQGMVKLGSYDKGRERYSKRTESTVKPFIELDREALAMVYAELNKFLNNEKIENEELKSLLEGGNFGKLYASAIKKIESALKDETKSDEGIWKKYEQGSDPNILFNDIYGKGTGWCTAGSLDMAASHVGEGDFYVYYTKDRNGEFTCPRIAIRKSHGKIAEIRGIEAHQNIESNMENVVSKKLEEPEFPDRDEYKRKVEDMQMMTYIDAKIKHGGELTVQDLRFLYEIDHPVIGFGYSKDPRINEIIDKRDKKADISLFFDLEPKEISIHKRTALNGKCSIHVGDLELPKILTNCVVPKVIAGELIFDNVDIIENVTFDATPNMTSIDLENAKLIKNVKFPDNIEKIYLRGILKGDIVLPKNLKVLALLTENKCDLSKVVFPPKLEELMLEHFDESKGLSNLPLSLKLIQVDKLKNLSSIKLPPFLEILDVAVNSISGVELPESITDIDFHMLSTLDGVKLPPNLISLNLPYLKDAKDLGELPLSLKKLYISSVENIDNLTLPEGLKELDISNVLDVYGVKFPNTLELLYLDSVRNLEGVPLPIGLTWLSINNVTDLNNINLPSNLKNLSADCVRSINGVELPSSLETLCLNAVERVEDITFPPKLKYLYASSLKSGNKIILPKDLEVVDLSSLETVEHLVLPENPKKINLPVTMDFSCIEVPKDEKVQEKIIDAIIEGYEGTEYGRKEIKTAISNLEKHFAQSKKQDESIINTTKASHLVAIQKEQPQILNIPKKAVDTVKHVFSSTKEKLQELKERLIYSKTKAKANNINNEMVQETVAEEIVERKKK